MSKNPCDGCDGCKGSDKLADLMMKMNDPKGFLKPGQKIGPREETLIRKGGYRALFNPGMNELDFFYGQVVKNLLLVDGGKETRRSIIRGLEGTVFDVYVAPAFEDALTVLKRINIFDYAVLGSFPEKKDAPVQNPDKLFDRIVEHSSDAKVFAYTAVPEELARPYRQILWKGDKSIADVCSALIRDAEKVEFNSILIGDDNIEKFRIHFGLDKALKGRRVDYASTPESTIELSKKKKYDIIVTDLQYSEGGCEGFDVLEQVKELAPFRVLWTGAADSPEVIDTAIKCGAQYVFHKNETDKLLKLLSEGLK